MGLFRIIAGSDTRVRAEWIAQTQRLKS